MQILPLINTWTENNAEVFGMCGPCQLLGSSHIQRRPRRPGQSPKSMYYYTVKKVDFLAAYLRCGDVFWEI